MSFYDVLRRFELLSGLEGKDLSRYTELCREASEEMTAKLKVAEDSLTSGEKLRLAYAAGALAFYKYCLYSSVAEPEKFTAGEVSISMSVTKVDAAKRLFEEECKGLGRVLSDSGFYFGRVKV